MESDHDLTYDAARALSALAAAPSDRDAWRHWRTLERHWDHLSASARRELRLAARRLAASGADARGHLDVVERLPD